MVNNFRDTYIHIYLYNCGTGFLRNIKRQNYVIIYTTVTEDLFCEEKNDIAESTENAYHVTRQNLHFVHASCNKIKNDSFYSLYTRLTFTCRIQPQKY